MNIQIANPKSPDFSYARVLHTIQSLFSYEKNPIANMANFSSFIQNTFGYHWTGFYLVHNEELVLGPFQGPLACTRIGFGKGVCGKAWEEKKTQYVPNVHEFPGHIACSAHSNSELVIPLIVDGHTLGVLDIDSIQFDDFSAERIDFLEQACKILINQTEWTELS